MLASHLQHALVLRRRFGHLARLFDRVRHRLLQVDVLARGHGVDRHLRVPVVRRGDEHAVHIRPGEQFPVIVVDIFLLQLGRSARPLLVFGVDIAQSDDLHILLFFTLCNKRRANCQSRCRRCRSSRD